MAADDIERRLAAQAGLRERLAGRLPHAASTRRSPDETRARVEDALAEALAPVFSPLPFGEARGRPRG